MISTWTMRYDRRTMTTERTYGDGCAIAHGLDLVGERWALLVVRELLLGRSATRT